MRNRTRLVCASLGATLLLALAVGAASANRLSVSNQQFRITWTRLTFSEGGGGFAIECPVTLEGSFHSATIRKVAHALVGHITRASVISRSCTGGGATVLNGTLPWHVTYEAFIGTLPNIGSVRLLLINASFQIGIPPFTCLARTTNESPAAGTVTREAGGNITTLAADSSFAIPTTGAFCPFASGRFAGTGNVFLLGSTSTRIRLTLI